MRPDWRPTGGFSTVGLEMALSVLFGTLAGQWLDGKLGTSPWLLIAGVFFGAAAAGRFLWRAARRMQKATEKDGFDPSHTGRPARFALEEKERRRNAG
jgi:F0F1-type ATP synthase assembly protein I